MALTARKGDAATPHTLAFAVFTADCTGRKCAAGSGMPLPYSGAHHLTTAGTNWKCLPEIAPQGHFLALRAQGATAPSGPRNDKSGSIAPLNSCHQYCQPAWRSLSAATDAIGRCVFIDTLHELEVPSRDCHVASLLAMTHQGSAGGTCPSPTLAHAAGRHIPYLQSGDFGVK